MPRSKTTTSLDERLEKAIDALGETISRYRPKLGTGIHSDHSPTPLELWNATPECRGLSFRYYKQVWQETMREYFPTMVYIENTGEWLNLGGF